MTRQCPGCGGGMQVLTSGAVEVDRCKMCGGLWLDRGELGQITGKPLKPSGKARRGKRQCVGCSKALAEVRVGQVHLDVCRQCGGVFLDDGELHELAKRKVPLAQSDLTFRCPGCAERFDLREGMATSNGLACPRCYGTVGHGPSPVPMDDYAYLATSGDGPSDPERGVAGAVNAMTQRGPTGLLAHLGTSFLFWLADASTGYDDDW